MEKLDAFFPWLFSQHMIVQRIVCIIIVLFTAIFFISLFRKFLVRAEKRGLDPSARPLLNSLVSYAVYILTLLIVLHILGVNTTGLVAMIGAASLAIGLALKDTLSNIASGILLLFLRPFKAGDYIECGVIKGRIIGINLFNTMLETTDGLAVSAPNRSLWGDPIINYSKNPIRRLEVTVGIDYGDSLDNALSVLRQLVASEPLFLDIPAPQFFVSELADSSVNVTFRAWVRTVNYWDLLWKYNELVKKRFDAAGITIPFPQRVLHVVDDSRSDSKK